MQVSQLPSHKQWIQTHTLVRSTGDSQACYSLRNSGLSAKHWLYMYLQMEARKSCFNRSFWATEKEQVLSLSSSINLENFWSCWWPSHLLPNSFRGRLLWLLYNSEEPLFNHWDSRRNAKWDPECTFPVGQCLSLFLYVDTIYTSQLTYIKNFYFQNYL